MSWPTVVAGLGLRPELRVRAALWRCRREPGAQMGCDEWPASLSSRPMSYRWMTLVSALLAVGCAGERPVPNCPTSEASTAAVSPAAPKPPADPVPGPTLKLAPYQSHGHRTIDVTTAGTTSPFLFDTGGGVSFVSPDLAERMGCTPGGQLVGYRMRGDDVRFPRCAGLELVLDGLNLSPATVGVFDLGKLLPAEWPLLGGLIALSSFEGRVLTVDLAAGRLEVDVPRPAVSDSVEINLVRQASGFSVVVLVPVQSNEGTLWLELDSGSSAPLILAPHAARALGMDVPASTGRDAPTVSGSVSIGLPNVGPVVTEAKVADIIYDGNIGAPLMERFRWTLDLANRRVRVESSHASDQRN